ncbi:MAG TPA: SH3 domain-containing protein, partial [Candidatus Limnocylindrales bacterium]|nr:SH3 domain-containing protein [Candidatus Limnocylindrales bacterium]
GDDLDPTTTWLFISSVAPDGGTYTGWINALFLAVSAPNGQPQRLADLPLTPRNTAGEYNSSFVPTALPTQPFENQVVATVDQLNPGSNLHLRRNPDPAAESLALIPAGTQVVVEGVNDTGEWYQTTFNGTTGWISVNYVSLTFNGRPFDPVNLSVLATPTPTATPLPTASA